MSTKFTNKRSGFSMIELVFVIVILGVLAAVAVPRFVATRTDAQIATARSDFASVQKAIVAKVFADNIDTTASQPTDPNRPWMASGAAKLNGWGEWIMLVGGLDGSRWGIPTNTGGDKLSSKVNPIFGGNPDGWCTVARDEDAVSIIGNVTQNAIANNRNTKGMCAAVLGIATSADGNCGSGGYLIVNPANAAMPFLNSQNVNLLSQGNNNFCIGFSKSFMSSNGVGNKVIPLASSGTIEF